MLGEGSRRPMDSGGSGGVEGGGWQRQVSSRGKRAASGEERGVPEKQRRTKSPEELVVLFRVKGAKSGDAGFRAINPLQIGMSLQSQIGEGSVAKVLFNGVLKVTGVNRKQYEDAMSVGKVVMKVERISITSKESQGIKGVVYGVFAGLSEKEIVDNITGGQVIDAVRFKSREGAGGDPPVLLTFKDAELPGRVFLGCMAYQVREYVRPPLRCYNCQRYGHIADSCRGKKRCAKCGGDHGIKECEAGAPKCPNCGGGHVAAYRGCEHTIKARQVQAVKERDSVSYAEAVRTVTNRESGAGSRSNVEQGSKRVAQNVFPPDMLVLSKESFLSFVVDVLVAAKHIFSSKTANRSDIIREVVGAAERFLGAKQVPEELHQHMSQVRQRVHRQREDMDEDSSIVDDVGDY